MTQKQTNFLHCIISSIACYKSKHTEPHSTYSSVCVTACTTYVMVYNTSSSISQSNLLLEFAAPQSFYIATMKVFYIYFAFLVIATSIRKF